MKFLPFYFLWAMTFGSFWIRIYSGSATLKSKHGKREGRKHWLIKYIDTKAKCRHPKNLPVKQVFIRVYRLEIQSVILVFSTQFFDLLSGSTLPPTHFPVSKYSILLGPPSCAQAFPNLRPGLLNCRRGTGRVKITRESNLSQDQPSVPHSPGEW